MSVLNMLDARCKLLFILLFTVLVFIVDKLSVCVCLLLAVILVRLAFRTPMRVFRMIKNLTLLATFIILIQTIFGPGDTYILTYNGTGYLKQEGFHLGLIIICRVGALFILLPVFTETTVPEKIASGLAAMGINYKIAFIFTAAFNLIPVFRDEALVIMDAQRLRGMRRRGLAAFTGLLVPLMLGAMRKAQVSSVAMDCRSFGVYKTRTWIDKPKMKSADFIFIFISVVFFICFVLFNYL